MGISYGLSTTGIAPLTIVAVLPSHVAVIPLSTMVIVGRYVPDETACCCTAERCPWITIR